MTEASISPGARILVTGAGGCLGAWVVKELREQGYQPVAFDLVENRERLKLLVEEDVARSVPWITGDIADQAAVFNAVAESEASAIIHLAALQVPFCKADPALGARVNVVGTVNVFEAARRAEISRTVYASSIAATVMGTENPFLATLYGAYKVCNEQTADVYWRDWGIASVGIRPAIIYGPARDQGMSAAPTVALMAAMFDIPYTVPFSGDVSFVHAQDAAQCLIGAALATPGKAEVYEMNGVQHDVARVLDEIKALRPSAEIQAEGNSMPFPADPDDGALLRRAGIARYRDMRSGLRDTLDVLENARQRGAFTREMVLAIMEKL